MVPDRQIYSFIMSLVISNFVQISKAFVSTTYRASNNISAANFGSFTNKITYTESKKDLSIKSFHQETDEKSKQSKAFLTIFVASAPDNKEKRDVLRKTWPSS